MVVPHSDDEIILYGGLIQRALKEMHDVHVALITNGDYENEIISIVKNKASYAIIGNREKYILNYDKEKEDASI